MGDDSVDNTGIGWSTDRVNNEHKTFEHLSCTTTINGVAQLLPDWVRREPHKMAAIQKPQLSPIAGEFSAQFITKSTPRIVMPADVAKAKAIARMLAADIVTYARDRNSKTRKRFTSTMRRVVDKLLHRHSMLFSGMVHKLQVSRETGHCTFVNVMDEMLTDRHFNWGRLVTIYAFAVRLVTHCIKLNSNNNIEGYCSDVAGYLGDYVAEHLSEWIAENGGWVRLKVTLALKASSDGVSAVVADQ